MTDPIIHTGALWGWRAKEKGAWHFVTLDNDAGKALSEIALLRRLEFGQRRGWGSLKVTATIGKSRWQTSVFPQKDGEVWLLPVKKAIRGAEGLTEGDLLDVELELL